MAGIPIQSAKFNKDVVVYFAVALFFLIVSAELFLSIWLPWHLRLDSMWAEQVARRELIERFDAVRGQARRIALNSPKPADGEAGLIQKNLDRLTGYLHTHGERLSPEQCKVFMRVVNQLQTHLSRLNGKYAFSAELPLDDTRFLKNLRGVKP